MNEHLVFSKGIIALDNTFGQLIFRIKATSQNMLTENRKCEKGLKRRRLDLAL